MTNCSCFLDTTPTIGEFSVMALATAARCSMYWLSGISRWTPRLLIYPMRRPDTERTRATALPLFCSSI